MLPEPAEVRRRIASVDDQGLRRYLAATLTFGCRPNELCGVETAGDRARGLLAIGPSGRDAAKDEFEGREAYLFTLRTEKRKGLPRTVGLPGAEFEPWAPPLYEHFRAAGEAPVFPFTYYWVRDQVRALGVFEGLEYKIEGYSTMSTLGGTKVVSLVAPHAKPFDLRALRHMRAKELRTFYRFSLVERAAFMGHSVSREVKMAGTYDTPEWWEYFDKLCRRRP